LAYNGPHHAKAQGPTPQKRPATHTFVKESLKNILVVGCLAWSAMLITAGAGSDLPTGVPPTSTAAAPTHGATPEQVLPRLDQELRDHGRPGGRAFLQALKEKLGPVATSGDWPQTLRQMEQRIQARESTSPSGGEPLTLPVAPDDVLVLLSERLQRHGPAGGRLFADQVKVALGNRAWAGGLAGNPPGN